MNSEQTNLLITKIIKLTNENIIHWDYYIPSQASIILPSASFLESGIEPLVSVTETNFIPNKSFAANFQDGYIFLLAYSGLFSIPTVKLFLQKDSETPSMEIASTNSGDKSETVVLLKRLYNLAELPPDRGMNMFINDILNS